MAAITVHFDRELRHLGSEDAQAWRLWLIEHQLDALTIACPSDLRYDEPAGKKPADFVGVWDPPGECG
jgi:hypothetical protein